MSTPNNSATNTNIPNPGVPFLDKSGRISPVWWAFLLALFQRTGGGGDQPPSDITLDDVLALETIVPPFTPADAQSLLIAIEQLTAMVAAQMQRDQMTEMTFASV
jgi:hypothetical protein